MIQVCNSGILASWKHKISTYTNVPARAVGMDWMISRHFFHYQWCSDSMNWKYLRSLLIQWAEYLTMHLFLIYVLGPLDFFFLAWRSQNQVLSLKMDANQHRTCGVCPLCCHCIILYHEEVISHFTFAENQISWMYTRDTWCREGDINHWLQFHIVHHSCYGPFIAQE